MTPDTTPALRPVQPQTDFLVEPRPDLGLTAVPWLLAAADDPQRARREWDRGGIALLRCGVRFTAVRFTAGLVQAAADSDDLRGIDAYLGQVLPGGPAFADTRWGLYYALVPAGTDRLPPWSYHSEDAERLGPNAYLGVPDPTHTDPGVGGLCLLITVASFGFLFPGLSAVGQSRGRTAPGTMSALLGVAQFSFGAAASPLIGLFGTRSATPMAVVMSTFLALMAIGAIICRQQDRTTTSR
ncbi:hypothetical protein IM697_31270 [Streptomyces ferrugineus]|uniref:Major facilitator superfamily (MFS) profile domain-containing protein n=1 Tax=Streptomyces ferrugineus TaxID=1413221 RepID=A0A7M2SH94_9ACTN|nr:hypothetical protein [Streptomyces ferrugineus]QOV34571.1 hypothetical protein IM697_31270 [Streptomyces ferrugineus]